MASKSPPAASTATEPPFAHLLKHPTSKILRLRPPVKERAVRPSFRRHPAVRKNFPLYQGGFSPPSVVGYRGISVAGATISIRSSTFLALSTATITAPVLPTFPDPPDILVQLDGALVSLGVLPLGDTFGDENLPSWVKMSPSFFFTNSKK